MNNDYQPNEVLLDLADTCRPCASDVRELVRHLPETEEELDRLFEFLVDESMGNEFHPIILAALHAGRTVDARHLLRGAGLLRYQGWLHPVALRCAGEVGPVLCEAARSASMDSETRAAALFAAAVWMRENTPQADFSDLLTQARTLARRRQIGMPVVILLALAELLDDEGLKSTLRWVEEDKHLEIARAFIPSMEEAREAELLSGLPELPEREALSGYTVRRAVAKVGRNEPCPCGSGRKYKKCCLSKDRAALADSSDVPGVTRTELRRQPEAHLNLDRLLEMRRYELQRLDPAKVPENVVPVMLSRLCIADLYDEFVRVYEVRGCNEVFKEWLFDGIYGAAQAGRKDIVRKLAAYYEGNMERLEKLPLNARFMLLDEELGPGLALLEQEALSHVDSDVVDFAYAMLCGPTPALGIHVARGVILSALYPNDADLLLEELLQTRDRLRLPPEDCIQERADELWWEDDNEVAGDAGTSDQQNALVDATLEVQRLRAELRTSRADLQKLQERADMPPVAAVADGLPPPPTADEKHARQLKQLNERIGLLKETLIERHGERNELRRELREAQQKLDGHSAMQTKPSGAGLEEESEEEDAYDLPSGEVPARLPMFPADMEEKLSRFPRRVARSVVRAVGLLGSGDRGAFGTVRSIRRDGTLYRQRIGRDYRLLFRMDERTIDVVDLVSRQDFERRLRDLLG